MLGNVLCRHKAACPTWEKDRLLPAALPLCAGFELLRYVPGFAAWPVTNLPCHVSPVAAV